MLKAPIEELSLKNIHFFSSLLKIKRAHIIIFVCMHAEHQPREQYKHIKMIHIIKKDRKTEKKKMLKTREKKEDRHRHRG